MKKEQNLKTQKQAISLIVLVITIIVLGILATAVVISISNTNIMTKAKSSTFKSNMQSYQEAYSIWYANEVIENGSLLGDNVNVSYASNPTTFVEIFGDNVPTEYLGSLKVENSKVVFYTADPEREDILESLGMAPMIKVIKDISSCSLSVSSSTVSQGEAYTATLVPNTGYSLSDLTVKLTMGGTDITEDVYNSSTGEISIDRVTSSVEITASYVYPTYADGSWDSSKGVNKPLLGKGMTGVYWDGSGNEVTVTEGNASSWYDYSSQNWANAKTADGSYWVWIPRYAYKFESGRYTSTAGVISVKFLQGKTDKDSTGVTISKTYPSWSGATMESYVVHPTFINDSASNYMHGGWDAELSGIWVAKYEMSNDGSGNMLSVPGVASWRSITIGNSYTNCLNYLPALQSHLMKNSEWGAVAYLAQSSFGRNGVEVTINSSSSFYTGGSENATANTNPLQSTTGNNTGIFDMSGGSWERVAGYITNGNGNISYGSSFATTTINTTGYLVKSTKFVTVYPYNSSSDSNTNNYIAYKNAGYGYGDAILETSTAGSGATSWFSDYSSFADTSSPFFGRGGGCSDGSYAGLFCFARSNGGAYTNYSFRSVCVGL